MLFNLRYCFNANEQARRYLLCSDWHVQVSQVLYVQILCYELFLIDLDDLRVEYLTYTNFPSKASKHNTPNWQVI